MSKRGTAAMDLETRTEVARKGGQTISKDRDHMSAIGKKGGRAISQNKAHMSAIGKIGGSRGKGRKKPKEVIEQKFAGSMCGDAESYNQKKSDAKE